MANLILDIQWKTYDHLQRCSSSIGFFPTFGLVKDGQPEKWCEHRIHKCPTVLTFGSYTVYI